jgi:hypothetical protein
MSFFHHRCLYPFVDFVLTSEKKQKDLDPLLQEKCLFYDSPAKVNMEKLYTAKILYVYPDTFDEWTDILLLLQQRKPLPVKLMIFCDSDISFCMDHLEVLFAFFPDTQFWIQNWLGFHERATLLPIGVSNILPTVDTTKEKSLGISFAKLYIGCKAREDFYAFINSNSEIREYCFPKTNFEDFCSNLAKCSFHTCPMGEGPDTLRFWESLAVKTVPIVINDEFYDFIHYYYPEIPMIRLSSWNELPEKLPRLKAEEIPDLPYLYEEYWITKLKKILDA